MKITKITFYPITSRKAGNLVASVSVCFDGVFVVNGFKLAYWSKETDDLTVFMPNHSYTNKDGKTAYKDDCFFLDKKEKNAFIDEVVKEWDTEKKRR